VKTVALVAIAAVLVLSVTSMTAGSPASARTLGQGHPYGCQINPSACASGHAANTALPSQLPSTGGAAKALPATVSTNGMWLIPLAALTLLLALSFVRRSAFRRS
jgi:hypothetical protein